MTTQTGRCPHCGWPDDRPFEVLSAHRTSAGQTFWTRCACGSTQMRAAGAVVARGAPIGMAPRVEQARR
ncbi:MAG: hypothetical protein ACRDMV_06355 [Streptosporangiales bacterium]